MHRLLRAALLKQKIVLLDFQNGTHLAWSQLSECILEFHSQIPRRENAKPTSFGCRRSGRVFLGEILEWFARLKSPLETDGLVLSFHCDEAQADTYGLLGCRWCGSNSEDQGKKVQDFCSSHKPSSEFSVAGTCPPGSAQKNNRLDI